MKVETNNSEYRKNHYILKRKGLIPLSKRELLRKEKIIKELPLYSSSRDFRSRNYVDYNWISSHGLSDEIFIHFLDYVRRKKYKAEREEKIDKEAFLFQRAKRNAEKCYDLKEFKKRFVASYNYIVERKLDCEIVKLFKQKQDGADKT